MSKTATGAWSYRFSFIFPFRVSDAGVQSTLEPMPKRVYEGSPELFKPLYQLHSTGARELPELSICVFAKSDV